MPHALTLAAIRALSDEALCLALEKQCYGRHWGEYSRGATGAVYVLQALHSLRYGFLQDFAYTDDWKPCMAVWWKYGRNIDIVRFMDGETLVRIAAGPVPAIRCITEAETRRAICELVLWQAVEKG
jgi:hypothetical protein